MKKYLTIFVAIIVMTSCSNEPNTLVTGYGDVEIVTTVNPHISNIGNAKQLTIEAPEVDDFTISATNVETGQTKSWQSLSSFNAGTKKMPAATYIFTAEDSNHLEEGFITPGLFASTEVMIRDNQLTQVNLDCKVGHTIFDCVKSGDVEKSVKDASIRIKSESGKYWQFTEQVGKPLCLRPGKVCVELTLKDFSGREVALRPFVVENALAAENRDLSLSVDGDKLLLDCGEQSQYSIVVNEELFSTPNPHFSFIGFENNQVLQVNEQSAPDEAVEVKLDVPGGLKNLYLTVDSPSLSDNPFAQETDVAGSKVLENYGILCDAPLQDAEVVTIDFTEFIKRLSANGTSSAKHVITMQVCDNAGRLAVEPMEITIESIPVSVSLSQVTAQPLKATQLTLQMECNASDVSENLRFEYSGIFDNEWTLINDASFVKKGDNLYDVTISIPSLIGKLRLRAHYLKNNSYSNIISFDRIVPDFSVACNHENIWSSQADLMLDCDEPEGLVPYLYVVVRQDGGEWHPAVTERSVADRRITVKTLMPGKNYEIAVYSDEKKCNTFMITTESALSLPNPDFEDYHNSISMKNVNCGGKYSNVATMIAVYNKADIYADEPDGWSSVNAKTCSSNVACSNTWFQVPSTLLVNNAYSGQYAVMLRNVGWSRSGVEPQRDVRTDREYYNGNAPQSLHRAAGKIFLGSYTIDASDRETYIEGIDFTSRPTAISGLYSYVQDYHDPREGALVEIEILNGNAGAESVIGKGRAVLSPSTSFTRFVVPVVYSVRNEKATRLKVLISSSSYASHSIREESQKIKTTDNIKQAVSIGATMIVDNLQLLYE